MRNVESYRNIIFRELTAERWTTCVQKMIEKAEKGDVAAFRSLSAYVDPTDFEMETTGGTIKVKFNIGRDDAGHGNRVDSAEAVSETG